MQIYILESHYDGEIYLYAFKDNTQLRKKLIKLFNSEFNYEDYPEERDEIIEELLNKGVCYGGNYDTASYYLKKQELL